MDAFTAADYDAARFKRAGRGRVYDSIVDTIGDTPLVRLPRLSAQEKPRGEVLATCDTSLEPDLQRLGPVLSSAGGCLAVRRN